MQQHAAALEMTENKAHHDMTNIVQSCMAAAQQTFKPNELQFIPGTVLGPTCLNFKSARKPAVLLSQLLGLRHHAAAFAGLWGDDHLAQNHPIT